MTILEYQALAARTRNKELTVEDRLVDGALGLCGEAGEIADLIKKHMFQGHKMDIEHIAKELGDCLWYAAETASAIGYDLETIMKMNIDKLRKRYPDGFDPEKSQNRAKGDV